MSEPGGGSARTMGETRPWVGACRGDFITTNWNEGNGARPDAGQTKRRFDAAVCGFWTGGEALTETNRKIRQVLTHKTIN